MSRQHQSEASPAKLDDREALLRRMLRARGLDEGDSSAGIGPITPVREGEAVASFAQERLWFFDQLQPGGVVYNVPLAFRLVGEVDVQALAGALSGVVARHAVLRTVFPAVDGRPVPRVLPVGGVPVVVAEVPDWPAAVREATEFSRAPFNLVSGPLVRATLFRISPTACLFVTVVHHIAFDGWSLGMFMREITTLYEQILAGDPVVSTPARSIGDSGREADAS